MIKQIVGRFDLLEIDKSHLEYLYRVRSSPIRRWFFDDCKVSWESHEKWFSSYCSSDDVMYVIKDTQNSTLIGTVGLKDYFKTRDKSNILEFGRFCIEDPDYFRKGFAYIILSRLLNHVFERDNVDIIYCETFSTNSVVALYYKLGFRITDFVKDYACTSGKLVDKVCMQLEKSDFYDTFRI